MNTEAKPKINIFKLVLIGIVFIVIILYTLFNIIELIQRPADLFVVEYGKISEEEDATGVIIRDEIVISGENEQNGLVQIKNEGERISKGESVFRYYVNNENELNSKINELDIQIQEALDGQTNIYSNDIKILDNEIENILEKIRRNNDTNKMKEYKKSINYAITKKAKIIGELSPSGTYIKSLINERTNLEKELNSEVEYVNAPVSGIVSYRIDGVEDEFSVDDLSSITKEKMENIELKTGQIVAMSDTKGKIINNFYTYIASLLNSEEAKNCKVGDIVTLRIITSADIKAEIVRKNTQDDGQVLIVFKITKGVEDLINYRKISMDVIWWSDNGLKVINSAIKYDGNIPYVVKNIVGYEYKIYVKIMSSNETYSVVKNYTTDEYKKLGFTDDEIRNMRKLTIYDEILTNPNV